MAFKNFVCWDSSHVRDVMNANAELASRHIFLAVHSEYPLTVSSPTVGDPETVPRWTIDPHDFLREFLSREKSHMQVVVLGSSGAGKSHFIRWIELNIPNEPDRYVISIPRSGISLRGIIERILGILPEEQAQPYRDRLNQAGDERSTPAHQKERLLSGIALAIGRDEPHSDSNPDLEAGLIDGLPNLFNYPYLRGHFRRAGGVIEQLANHVLSPSSQYDRVEAPREFSVADLPLTGIQRAEMSGPACSIADFLCLDTENQATAVDIINRNLHRAIGQVLHFTGDRLIQLLSDVRRHLRQQGQELVLLIEDLARLQGLDLALLEALIVEGRSSDDDGLCTLRWVAAVTTGYYYSPRVPDTVKTRMNFVLDMDLPTGGEYPLINDFSIVAFAARYLNAVRLNPEELSSWATLVDDERGNPPIACETCPHRTPCHSAFDAVDGIGLYPFNRNALLNMLRRHDPRLDEQFNPRTLVKEVLAELFGTYGRDLANDRFPPGQLLNQMGGAKLPPVVGDGLRRHDPEHAQRQLAVLELWGAGGSTVTDLPEGVYSAFGLPKPIIQDARSASPEPEVEPSGPVRSDRWLEAIRAWGNGGVMQDDLLNHIRPRVFESIVSHIVWDRESLVRSAFAGGGSPLRIETLAFRRQLTQPRFPPVRLEIPLQDEKEALAEAAMALEGLHLFRQHGNWGFANGPRLFEALANCLDEWSSDVVTQLNRLPEPPDKWDAAASAVEVLAIGAAMGGRPPRASATLPDFLNALFEEWPQDGSAQSPEWRTLYEAVRRDQPRLRDIALARASGTKGGQRGAFVDPSKLLPSLRKVRRRWELTYHPPDGTVNRPDDYGRLARLHARVAANLSAAAKAEWRRKTAWVDDWRRDVPEGITRKDMVDAVRGLVELAVKHGISFDRRIREAILSALTELEGVQLDDALRVATTLRVTADPLRRLPELGRDRSGNAMAAVALFLPAVHRLLDELEASVANRMAHRGQGAKDIEEHQARIREALSQLSRDLGVIGGANANAD